LEVTYGGTAPVVSKFWPPIMPEMVEASEVIELEHISVIPRSEYIKVVKENPNNSIMP